MFKGARSPNPSLQARVTRRLTPRPTPKLAPWLTPTQTPAPTLPTHPLTPHNKLPHCATPINDRVSRGMRGSPQVPQLVAKK